MTRLRRYRDVWLSWGSGWAIRFGASSELGVKSPRGRHDQAAAAKINQGGEGSALWKPKARWLIRRILELSLRAGGWTGCQGPTRSPVVASYFPGPVAPHFAVASAPTVVGALVLPGRAGK